MLYSKPVSSKQKERLVFLPDFDIPTPKYVPKESEAFEKRDYVPSISKGTKLQFFPMTSTAKQGNDLKFQFATSQKFSNNQKMTFRAPETKNPIRRKRELRRSNKVVYLREYVEMPTEGLGKEELNIYLQNFRQRIGKYRKELEDAKGKKTSNLFSKLLYEKRAEELEKIVTEMESNLSEREIAIKGMVDNLTKNEDDLRDMKEKSSLLNNSLKEDNIKFLEEQLYRVDERIRSLATSGGKEYYDLLEEKNNILVGLNNEQKAYQNFFLATQLWNSQIENKIREIRLDRLNLESLVADINREISKNYDLTSKEARSKTMEDLNERVKTSSLDQRKTYENLLRFFSNIDMDEANNVYDQVQFFANTFEKEKLDLLEKINDQQLSIEERNQDLLGVQRELSNVREQLRITELDLENKNKELEEQRKSHGEIEYEYENLNKDYENARKKLREYESRFRSTSIELDGANRLKDDLKEELSEKTRENEKLKENLESVLGAFRNLGGADPQNTIKELEAKIMTLGGDEKSKQAVESVVELVKELERKSDALKSAQDEIEKIRIESQKKLEDNNKEIESIRENLKNSDDQIKRLNADLDNAKNSYEQVKSELKISNEKLNTGDDKIKRLEQEIEDLKKVRDSYEKLDISLRKTLGINAVDNSAYDLLEILKKRLNDSERDMRYYKSKHKDVSNAFIRMELELTETLNNVGVLISPEDSKTYQIFASAVSKAVREKKEKTDAALKEAIRESEEKLSKLESIDEEMKILRRREGEYELLLNKVTNDYANLVEKYGVTINRVSSDPTKGTSIDDFSNDISNFMNATEELLKTNREELQKAKDEVARIGESLEYSILEANQYRLSEEQYKRKFDRMKTSISSTLGIDIEIDKDGNITNTSNKGYDYIILENATNMLDSLELGELSVENNNWNNLKRDLESGRVNNNDVRLDNLRKILASTLSSILNEEDSQYYRRRGFVWGVPQPMDRELKFERYLLLSRMREIDRIKTMFDNQKTNPKDLIQLMKDIEKFQNDSLNLEMKPQDEMNSAKKIFQDYSDNVSAALELSGQSFNPSKFVNLENKYEGKIDEILKVEMSGHDIAIEYLHKQLLEPRKSSLFFG